MSLIEFEKLSQSCFEKIKDEKKSLSEFIDSLTYSFYSGGKRVRPNLLYTLGEDFKIESKDVFPAAFAVELIHTYSLVHDDLPAMDDDKFRRGKLTHHAKYGEASAILAGDALLTLAFEVLSDSYNGLALKQLVKTLSSCAGVIGMVGGQALDCLSTQRSEEIFNEIHYLKTAKLFEFCFIAPGYMAALGSNKIQDLKNIGGNLGLLFQLQDDLFDIDKVEDRKEENIISVISKNQLESLITNKKTEITKSLINLEPIPRTLELIDKVFKRKM